MFLNLGLQWISMLNTLKKRGHSWLSSGPEASLWPQCSATLECRYFIVIMWLVLGRVDGSWSHVARGILNWENASVRLVCRQVHGMFSWLTIDMRGPSALCDATPGQVVLGCMKRKSWWGWRDGPVAERTGYSCRGSEFSSQHPYGCHFQGCSSSRDLAPNSGLGGKQAHTRCTNAQHTKI